MTIIRKNRSMSVLKNLNKMRNRMNENATSFRNYCGRCSNVAKSLPSTKSYDCPNRESNLRPLALAWLTNALTTELWTVIWESEIQIQTQSRQSEILNSVRVWHVKPCRAFRSILGWGSQITFLNSSDLPSFEHLRCSQQDGLKVLMRVQCTPVKSYQNWIDFSLLLPL